MFEFKRNHIIVTVLVFMIAIAGYLSLEDKQSAFSTPNFNAEIEDGMDVAQQDLALHNDFFEQFSEINTEAPDAYDGKTGKLLSEEELEMLEAAMLEEQAEGNVEGNEVVEAGAMAPQTLSNEVIITKKVQEVAAGEAINSKNVDVSYFAEEKMLREQARAAQIEQLSEYVADSNIDKDVKAKAAENLIVIQERIEKENGAESLLRAKGFKDVFVRIDDDTIDVVVNDDELSDEEIAQIEEIVQRKTGCSVGQIKISRLSVNNQTAQN